MLHLSFPIQNSLYIHNKLQTSFWQKIHISYMSETHEEGDIE